VADFLGGEGIARPLTHCSFLFFGGWFVAQILIDAQSMFSIILSACLWAFNRTAAVD